MKNIWIWFFISVFLLGINGCVTASDEADNINKDETVITEEGTKNTEPTIPLLENSEYWEVVEDEIIEMLNSHNLYLSHISSAYPCVQFHVEPGKKTDDGKAVASGLTQEEYEEVYQCVKAELHVILDKYKLVEPKSAFHACDSIVGIYFNNWFVDEQKVADRVDSLWVAGYELDLLEYYYDYEENYFMRRDSFFEEMWSKYGVYTP